MRKKDYLYIFIVLSGLLSSLSFAEKLVKLSPKLRIEDDGYQQQIRNKFEQWRKQFIDIQVLTQNESENTPRVVSDRHGKVMSLDNDEVYINKLDKVNYTKPMGVYRVGKFLKITESEKEERCKSKCSNQQELSNSCEDNCDSQFEEIIDFPFYYLADAEVEKYNVENDLSLIKLSNTNKEVLMGDRILNKDNVRSIKIKTNKDKKLNGKIVSVINGVKNANLGECIIINLGLKDHIEDGDILKVIKNQRIKRSVQLYEEGVFKRDHFLNSKRDKNAAKNIDLPEEVIANILVYKTFDNFSAALVIYSKEPVMTEQVVTGGA